ncbi:YybH family protein [Christiangramia sabulilitoris]|nr:nuclear transport factor 2 family protein [Christiangramia sabulilitoris]
MKLFKLLPVFVLLLFSSCQEEKEETDEIDDMATQAELRDPAEANKQWIDAWNRNNPRELDTLTSDDAMLYMEGMPMNRDSIRSWYKNAAPMMKGLKTNPEVKYSSAEVAYEAGTYSHGMKSDTLNNVYGGSYTLIWKRVNNDWKLQVLNIAGSPEDNSDSEMPEDQ